ncbi:phage portal protein [Clostridium sp.]|uniref:phage portal protein n=1 Tax=Clostridium sp. TaxID=1506 RepID=UPI003993288D
MGIRNLFNNKTDAKEKIAEEKTTVDLNELVNRVRSVGDIGSSKLNSATYYSCMNIRCNAVAKLPLKLYEEKEQGSEKAKDHYLYSLLKSRPNNFMSTHDFLFLTEFYRLHYGNSYWYISTNKGKIDGLYILDPSLVSILIDNEGIVGDKMKVYYQYNQNGELIIYDFDEICHFKNFAVNGNGLKGTSIRYYLLETIEIEQRANKVITEKYKNGLINPLIVEYTGDLNEAKQQSIKNKFAKMGGTKNAGKVVPIPADFRVNQLETKLSDSQFFEMQGLTTRQIANAFGIKGFQLNDMEKSTYNNIEQQNRAFYSDTLQNVLTTYEQEMDYKLLSSVEKKEGYFFKFNVDSVVRSDLATRYEAYTKAINAGYMTIAEVRDKEDLPFIEGTDKLIIGNGASIPFEDLGKQYVGGGDNNE